MLSIKKKIQTYSLALITLASYSPAFADDDDLDEVISCEGPLHVMLVNDDGYDAIGLTTMRAGLQQAGFDVTVVAPLENQSGKGGAINTDVGGPISILEQEPGVWSVDGTPADSIRVGLRVILENNPPDIVVSGINPGPNTGRGVVASSGTVAAAFLSSSRRVPAIDVNMDLDFTEAAAGFPSTFAAMVPAADFTARLIGKLQQKCHRFEGNLLPDFGHLHIHYPPRQPEEIPGVAYEQLAEKPILNLGYSDPNGAVAAGGGDVVITFEFGDPAEFEDDVLALSEGWITVVALDGDLNADRRSSRKVRRVLRDLMP